MHVTDEKVLTKEIFLPKLCSSVEEIKTIVGNVMLDYSLISDYLNLEEKGIQKIYI